MENQQLIEEQFAKLPSKLREAISTTAWQKDVSKIAEETGLSSEQGEQLETETMLILYGFENIADLPENLKRELGLNDETAVALAEQINERVFSVIATKAGLSSSAHVPEVAPPIFPMVEEGEVVHDVPHVESAPPKVGVSAPVTPTMPPTPAEEEVEDEEEKDEEAKPAPVGKAAPSSDVSKDAGALPAKPSAYAGGKDPYREPLE